MLVTGVAFGDCILYGQEEAARIQDYLSSSSSPTKSTTSEIQGTYIPPRERATNATAADDTKPLAA